MSEATTIFLLAAVLIIAAVAGARSRQQNY
jgi:hypothetical protein